MTTKKKNITLINLSPPYGMEASTLILASSHMSSAVVQLLVCEKEILFEDLTATSTTTTRNAPDNNEDEDKENKNNKASRDDSNDEINEKQKGGKENNEEEDKEENDGSKKKVTSAKPIALESLGTFFAASHTVILPDSLFYDKSRVFHTELFLNNGGLEALQSFYKKGGTVIVMCLEGFLFSSGVDDKLNELFGTEWSIQLSDVDSCTVVPTPSGQSVLGPFTPKRPVLKDNPHFITCPNKEGLYKPLMQSKEEFVQSFRAQDEIFERLGIEEDDKMDCFNVDKSWEKYQERYNSSYAIAIHEGRGEGEGSVVWYGDRGQSETMGFVFCKLLNLHPKRRFGFSSSSTSSSSSSSNNDDKKKANPSNTTLFRGLSALDLNNDGGWTVYVSIVVVLIAILARILGIVQLS